MAAVALTLLLTLLPCTAGAVRVVTYNILNFPGSTGAAREDDFRTVVSQLDADVIVVQEMLSQTGVNQFLNNVLNYGGTGEYAAAPFINGYDTDNAMFYRTDAISFISQQAISTALRDINEYRVRPVGYSSPKVDFRVYSLHLKAGSTSSDKSKRLAEATVLRDHMNSFPAGQSFMVAGDLNIRASTESAYQKLVGSESNNNGRVFDPLSEPGNWHDNAGFAWLHTQSPRTTSFGGGATGGMDDRFDQILISYALDDGEGMDYIDGSYVSYGNDGMHFNTAINSGTNYAVSAAVADALHEAADHLPVYADFDVPAKLDAPLALEFGSVMIGCYAALPLVVGNVATPPADELDHELAAPAGFAAPVGVFEVQPGHEIDHVLTMNTDSPGVRTGTLIVSTDDYDNPTWDVSLSGTVLEHASPSLCDTTVLLESGLGFGTHGVGAFEPIGFSVHNLGYSGLQALLDVHAAEFAGGDGRFGFTGGFAPATAGMSPAEFTIGFDDAGPAEHTLYTGTLVLRTRDDTAIHGWSELDSLVVDLSAMVQSGSSVPDGAISSFALSFSSANPFRDEVALELTTPDPGSARVQVFDVRGRLVRTLLSGEVSAGSHSVVWDGRDEFDNKCASGVYLSRACCGARSASRKLVLLR